MREIKFRAYSMPDKMMIYFNNRPFINDTDDEGLVFPFGTPKHKVQGVMDFFLMQYTGLKDKNGKEIYEGDIVKQKGCMFCKSEPEYIEVSYDEFSCMGLEGIGFTFWENAPGSLEIIGNIYENKDLLK